MDTKWYDEYRYHIIFAICLIYLIIVGVLKIKYAFWYSQPLSFRISPRWWCSTIYHSCLSSKTESAASSSYLLTCQNNLSESKIITSYNGNQNAVLLPFIYNVNRENIIVYRNQHLLDINDQIYKISRAPTIQSIPFSEIAHLINCTRYRKYGYLIGDVSRDFVIPCVDYERLGMTVTTDTHGLSPFVGVYKRKTYYDTVTTTGNDRNYDARDTFSESDGMMNIRESYTVEGAVFLLPRQKIEYDILSKGSTKRQSITATIYVCDHHIWNHMLLNEQQSLELLETTEYFQKSREIAGELTLYRYSSIPAFVVPFTTFYTYGISLAALLQNGNGNGNGNGNVSNDLATYKYAQIGTVLVKVTSVNFDIFYRFIIEQSRDFRCNIIHPVAHLQHLVDSALYHIYMLIINDTLVVSTYIFGPSWLKSIESLTQDTSPFRSKKRNIRTHKERIQNIHERISNTSTALVKYLPPKKSLQYDLSGKLIRNTNDENNDNKNNHKHTHTQNGCIDIPRLISSIQSKQTCDIGTFISGFINASRDLTKSLDITSNNNNTTTLIIDTFSHNYIILDTINKFIPPIWIDKWYYVMYNANIHTELLCKDLFFI
jgi:hypothetical protein